MNEARLFIDSYDGKLRQTGVGNSGAEGSASSPFYNMAQGDGTRARHDGSYLSSQQLGSRGRRTGSSRRQPETYGTP